MSMNGWRTMESAPMRTRVLIWTEGKIRLARNDPGTNWTWSDGFGSVRVAPTHWHPLPDPPDLQSIKPEPGDTKDG